MSNEHEPSLTLEQLDSAQEAIRLWVAEHGSPVPLWLKQELEWAHNAHQRAKSVATAAPVVVR